MALHQLLLFLQTVILMMITFSHKLELLGFAMMVYGTLTYKKLMKFPIQALYTDEHGYPAVGYKSPFMASMHK